MAKTNYSHSRPANHFDALSEVPYSGEIPTEDTLSYVPAYHPGASDHLGQSGLTARLGEIIRPELADKLKRMSSEDVRRN